MAAVGTFETPNKAAPVQVRSVRGAVVPEAGEVRWEDVSQTQGKPFT